MAVGGVKPYLSVLPLFVICACAPSPPADRGLLVSYDAKTARCVLKSNEQTIPFELSDADIRRIELTAKAWPGGEVTVQATRDAPYKCVGAAIFLLQRAKKQVTFLGEPPAK